MNDQAYQDDGAIPPPPPPPTQDDGAGFSPYTGQAGQSAAVPYAQQAQQQQYSGGQQYDPNFAHAPYDPNQAQAQQYADPYAQQAGAQQDFGQSVAQPVVQQGQQGGYYDDPFAAQAQGAAGQAGFDPMMGPPMGDFGDDGTTPPGAPPAPPKPSKPANFQLGTKLNRGLKIKLPAHNLQFDEEYFLALLAGSISLSKDEKLRIIESMPKLRQSQVDELIRIFEEEKQKFAELGEEHVGQLDKLAAQHYEDWVDLEMKQEQSSVANDDEAQAEEIRKSLGI